MLGGRAGTLNRIGEVQQHVLRNEYDIGRDRRGRCHSVKRKYPNGAVDQLEKWNGPLQA